MKRRLKLTLGVCITLALTLFGLMGFTQLVERKDSTFKYTPFFQEENDFDVLLMGTSHLLNAVFPMELWADYGMTSYNFGGHGSHLATTYWVLENALDYTTPKLIVLDCYLLSHNDKISQVSVEHAHISFDAFPLTVTKIKAIYDLIPEGDRMSFLWNFSIYHHRWSQLTAEDFSGAVTKEKGAESRVNVAFPSPVVKISGTLKADPDTVGVAYLEKIIHLCRERNIDLLLTYLPFPATEAQQMEAHLAADIAARYDVPYLNFLDIEGVINYQTDLYDAVSHVNPSGARKLTRFLGRYIRAHYALPDRRFDEHYASWHEDYEAYEVFKMDLLKAQDSLDTYLMLLADRRVTCEIYMKPDSPIMQDERLKQLVAGAVQENSAAVHLQEVISDRAGADIRIVVRNALSGAIQDEASFRLELGGPVASAQKIQ